MPKSNTDFWKEKLGKNVDNDHKHQEQLREMGWNVIVLWECELEKEFETTMDRVVALLSEEKSHG